MPIRLYDSLGHIESECLDLFCAGRLDALERQRVQAHLAGCEECRDYQRAERSFREAMREHQDLFVPAARRSAPSNWRSGYWSPYYWAPAAALAASLLFAVVTHSTATPAQPVDVVLRAMRGSAPQAAPAGPRLRLRLDQTGLPAALRPAAVNVDVVDTLGQVLLTGAARLEDGFAVFEASRTLAAGRSWVRLRHAALLVREYELVVQ